MVVFFINWQIIDRKDIPGSRQAVCLKRQGWHPRVAPGCRQANAKDALLFFYLFVFVSIDGIVLVLYFSILYLSLPFFAGCCTQLLQFKLAWDCHLFVFVSHMFVFVLHLHCIWRACRSPCCNCLECSKTSAHICTHQHQATTEIFYHVDLKTLIARCQGSISAFFNLIFSCEDVAHPPTLLQNHACKINPRCILKVMPKSSNLSLSEVCLLPALE